MDFTLDCENQMHLKIATIWIPR